MQQKFLPTQYITSELLIHVSEWWSVHVTLVLKIVHQDLAIGYLGQKLIWCNSFRSLLFLFMWKYDILVLLLLSKLFMVNGILLLKNWILKLLIIWLLLLYFHRFYRYLADILLDLLLSILKFLFIQIWLWQWSIFCLLLLLLLNLKVSFS